MRFVGDQDGVFGEAVRGLTGLRRDPGAEARKAQVEGQAVPALAPVVAKLQRYIPAFPLPSLRTRSHYLSTTSRHSNKSSPNTPTLQQ